MASQPCIDFITSQYIEKWNSTDDEILPQLSNGSDCSNGIAAPGVFRPASLSAGQINTFILLSDIGISSLTSGYIPANWMVTFRININQITISGPFLWTGDGAPLFPNSNTSINSSEEIMFTRRPIPPLAEQTISWAKEQRAICTQVVDLDILGVTVDRYQPHRSTCDTIMQNYCNQGNMTDAICSCFREAQELSQRYPMINLPVTCFGQDCATEGYRTFAMINESCSVTVCQSIINEQGTNIYNSGTTDIYCAGRIFNTQTVVPTVTPAVPTTLPKESRDTSVPTYAYAVLALSIPIAAVLIYLIFRKYGNLKPSSSSSS